MGVSFFPVKKKSRVATMPAIPNGRNNIRFSVMNWTTVCSMDLAGSVTAGFLNKLRESAVLSSQIKSMKKRKKPGVCVLISQEVSKEGERVREPLEELFPERGRW